MAPRWWLRLLFKPPRVVVDLALAVVLWAVIWPATSLQVSHSPKSHAMDVEAGVLVSTAVLVLAVRRLLPVFGFAASLLLALAFILDGHPWGPVVIAPAVALLTLVSSTPVRVWAPSAIGGAVLLGAMHAASAGPSLGSVIYAASWVAGAGIFGLLLEFRRRFRDEVEAAAQWAERSRAEAARRRLAEERLGLAREVHDVVGHSLAVISLQAGVAEHLLDQRPEEARKAVAAIRELSRQALDDVRAELAALRDGATGIDGEATSPGLAQLTDLVEEMRRAGLRVQLDVNGSDRPLPRPLAAAVYRIVQESLTNVVRHAGSAAMADVRVIVGSDGLEIEVTDTGPGTVGTVRDGGGLAGMRERVGAFGGRISAGNRPGGGFRVWAQLPTSAA